MKKRFSIQLMAIITLSLISLLLGCAEWNQARVEQKYVPPAKKEIVDDKTIYYYYFSGRSALSYQVYTMCVDITFDKNGKLINKREYYVQPDLENKQSDPLQIDPWLNTLSGGKPSEIDVTGRWRDIQGSGLFTWGEGYLRQEQGKVQGAIGGYDIKGVVSGKIVYLVFLSQGHVYYSARLEMFQDLLTGSYFDANDRRQMKGSPISLAKTVGQTTK
jgi:hypothetical protein